MVQARHVVYSLFQAIQARKLDQLRFCYSPFIVLSEPVFKRLEGDEVLSYWRAAFDNASEWELEFALLESTETQVRVEWWLKFTSRVTKRTVEISIQSVFEVRDGLVIKQKDAFNFRSWCSQILGPSTIWISWSPWFRAHLKVKARAYLIPNR